MANPVWLEVGAQVYEVGLVSRRGSPGELAYGILDRDGALASPPLGTASKLLVLYERASIGYLDPARLADLREFESSVSDVQKRNFQIAFLRRFQEEVLNLGVVGVATYFTGGTVVLNNLGNAMLDELATTVADAPKNTARGFAHGLIAGTKAGLRGLIEAVEQRERTGLGNSPDTPMTEAYIQRNFASAIMVDVYGIPSAELLVDLQPKSDWLSQVKRGLGVIGESTVETALTPAKAVAAKKLIFAGNVIGALEQGVPEMARYREKVNANIERWQNSNAGLGVDLKNSKLYARSNIVMAERRDEMPRPSFDCAKASSPIEKVICSDTTLAELDAEMARIYGGLRRDFVPADADTLKNDQRAWLLKRNKCENASDLADCVLWQIRSRIMTMRAYKALKSHLANFVLAELLNLDAWSMADQLFSEKFREMSLDCLRGDRKIVTIDRQLNAGCELPMEAALRNPSPTWSTSVVSVRFAVSGETVYATVAYEFIGAAVSYSSDLITIRDGKFIYMESSKGMFRSFLNFELQQGDDIIARSVGVHEGSRVVTKNWQVDQYRLTDTGSILEWTKIVGPNEIGQY